MYIFTIVSTIYICFLFSLLPKIYRENMDRKTLDEYEQEDKIDNEVENEFDFLDSDKENIGLKYNKNIFIGNI